MKIVSISDYAIHHRIGRSEPTGTTYITRFGNTRQKNVFKEFYKMKCYTNVVTVVANKI